MREEPTIQDAPLGAAGPEKLSGALAVRGLTFAYPGARAPALRDVSFEVKAGSTVAIVGRTGSGKSTLAQALLRLLEIPSGTVFFDGADATALPLARLRAAVGYVPQSPFLFSASLRENIAFADPRLPLDAVVRAAEAAGLARDVASFPDGWETIVGERGVQLSGGQRSRAALARAIAARPRLLILDDALAAVDTETAAQILDQLAAETQDATRLVISHRIAEVRRADLVLVLDAGRLVEQGTHESLLARDGVYAAIYREREREQALRALGAEGARAA
jgi:ATP-binding cassette subfamily B protein